MMQHWDRDTYDNRGFADWDNRTNFEEYMLEAIEPGGRWDYLDGANAADALCEYDYKPLKADMQRFMALHDKGQYREAADIIFRIVESYCDAQAKKEYNEPEANY